MNKEDIIKEIPKKIKDDIQALVCECGGGGWDYDEKEKCKKCNGTGIYNIEVYKIQDWLTQKLSALEQSTREKTLEEVKEDYIKYLTDKCYSKKYDGKTPFWEWKQTAEARDMLTWK